ncbi:hypothetical protein KWE57_03700 [Acinetobacter pittii]|uniref:hypothetical protein n=1 Tax=Acinetobacter pittii TaxID=48296 RepID=UPI00355AF5FF
MSEFSELKIDITNRFHFKVVSDALISLGYVRNRSKYPENKQTVIKTSKDGSFVGTRGSTNMYFGKYTTLAELLGMSKKVKAESKEG